MTATPPGEELRTSDPEAERAEIKGRVLRYADEGPRTAPVLMMIHGVPGSLRDFRYLAPQLSDRLRVVRFDLPGFGGSQIAEDAVRTLEGRVRATMALADHLRLERFGVLGHSMGGGTALLAAATCEQRISALVLVASIGLRPHRGLGMSPRALALFAAGLGTPLLGRALLRSARLAFQRRRFPGSERMDAAALALHFRAFGAVDFRLLGEAARAKLPPTLVAYAEDDPLVEPQIAHELLSAIPGSMGRSFASGGHNLQKTRAKELSRAILSLLGVPVEEPPSPET